MTTPIEMVPTVRIDTLSIHIDSATVHIDEALLIVVREKEGMEVTRHFTSPHEWNFKVGSRG